MQEEKGTTEDEMAGCKYLCTWRIVEVFMEGIALGDASYEIDF